MFNPHENQNNQRHWQTYPTFNKRNEPKGSQDRGLPWVARTAACWQRGSGERCWGEWRCWGVLLTLCTHRLKYPHQTIAALAASSPIEAILSFDQFDVLVAQAAGPECARSLRVATEAVEKALISDKVCH